MGKERAAEGQVTGGMRRLRGRLTTGPQVHRLPIRVLPQHFRGEVSRRPCEPCSPDTQTGRHTHRGWHVSNPEQDPAGRGMRLPWRGGKHSLPPRVCRGQEALARPGSKASRPGWTSPQCTCHYPHSRAYGRSHQSIPESFPWGPGSASLTSNSHPAATIKRWWHARQNVLAVSAIAEQNPCPLPTLVGAGPGRGGGLSPALVLP